MAINRKIDYEELFETWAGFDDAYSVNEVSKLIDEHDLGPVDAVSFAAFCYGYEKGVEEAGLHQ